MKPIILLRWFVQLFKRPTSNKISNKIFGQRYFLSTNGKTIWVSIDTSYRRISGLHEEKLPIPLLFDYIALKPICNSHATKCILLLSGCKSLFQSVLKIRKVIE